MSFRHLPNGPCPYFAADLPLADLSCYSTHLSLAGLASGIGQTESTLAQAQDVDLSASTGNDRFVSPYRGCCQRSLSGLKEAIVSLQPSDTRRAGSSSRHVS